MSDQSNTNAPSALPPNPPAPDQLESIWRECEAKLQISRADLEKVLTNSAAGQPLSPVDQARLRQITEILSSQAADPFGLLNRAIRQAQNAPDHTNPSPTPTPTPTNAPPQNPANSARKIPLASHDPSPSTSATDGVAPAAVEMPPAEPGTPGDAAAPLADVAPAPSPAPGFPDAGAGLSPFDGFDASSLVRAQAAQATGERLQAAFDQSAEATASLFEQMLALADGQNRKLAEVERKISELTGQLNSLKNP